MRITLDKVIELLKENYEKAKAASGVRKPISYALYRTWIFVDVHEKEKYNERG